jgi:hypothetical protein
LNSYKLQAIFHSSLNYIYNGACRNNKAIVWYNKSTYYDNEENFWQISNVNVNFMLLHLLDFIKCLGSIFGFDTNPKFRTFWCGYLLWIQLRTSFLQNNWPWKALTGVKMVYICDSMGPTLGTMTGSGSKWFMLKWKIWKTLENYITKYVA